MIFQRLLFFILLTSFAFNACRNGMTRVGKTSGQFNIQNKGTASIPLELTFSKSSYGKSDTIKSSIINVSDRDIFIALRCGHYLEMSYQISEKGQWSGNMQLGYMMLKCPTYIRTIKPQEKYEFSLPSSLLNATGYFRFIVPYTIVKEDTSQTLISVPFQIL